MVESNSATQFAFCLKNESYPVSLERRKVYQVIADPQAAQYGQVRIIDESGEDYLYPADYFVLIELPAEAEEAFFIAA